MDSNIEHQEQVGSDVTEVKTPDAGISTGEVTTSEGSQVTAGGDATSQAAVPAVDGQKSDDAFAIATDALSELPRGESTVAVEPGEVGEADSTDDKSKDEEESLSETAAEVGDGQTAVEQKELPEVMTNAPSESVQESSEKLQDDTEETSQESIDETLQAVESSEKSQVVSEEIFHKKSLGEETDSDLPEIAELDTSALLKKEQSVQGMCEKLDEEVSLEGEMEDTADPTFVQSGLQEDPEKKDREQQDNDDLGNNDEVNLLSEDEEETGKSTGDELMLKENDLKEIHDISLEDPSTPAQNESTANEDVKLKEDNQTKEQITEDALLEDDRETKDKETVEDALLKDDKQTEEQAVEDITAAEEDALLKDTEDGGEEKLEVEAMEVEDIVASNQGDIDGKQDDDVESMEVDDELKDTQGDVEMQSELGSVNLEMEQDEDKDIEAKVESNTTMMEEEPSESKQSNKSEASKDEDNSKSQTKDRSTGDTKLTTTAEYVSDDDVECISDAPNADKGVEQVKTCATESSSNVQKKTETDKATDKGVEEGGKESESVSETNDEKTSEKETDDVQQANADKTEADRMIDKGVEERGEESESVSETSDEKKIEKETDVQQPNADKESDVNKSITEKTQEDHEASEPSKSTEKSVDETSDDKTEQSESVNGGETESKTMEESTKSMSEPEDADDSGSNSRDTSKSPVTTGGDKKAVKKGKIGFSLGNIVSQLKKKCEKAAEKEDGMEGVQEGEEATLEPVAAPVDKEKDKEPESASATDKIDSTEEVTESELDKTKEVTSPTSKDLPSGSSRRKQNNASAQHITNEKDGSKTAKVDDDDDDIVEIVDAPSNENEGQMKNYATDTMNELLGMFGFDKVDQQETQGLKLGDKFSAKPPPNVKGGKDPVVSGAISMATKEAVSTKVPEKKVHCTECKQPITSSTNLGWGSQPFCSPNCLTNFQNRQTSVCEYCKGLISPTVRGKFTKEMQTGLRKEFCSSGCVTEFTKRLKTCSHCAKEVKAGEMIAAPVGAQNKFKEFCNQGCVDAFELKRQVLSKTTSNKGSQHPCAVCKKNAKVKHEINFQNNIHRLCSNECFGKFRSKHSLALNFCEQCGVICYNENLVPNVLLGGKMRRFCSQRCLGEYKVKNRKQVPCYNCKMPSTNHNMIEESGGTSGETKLFCTMQCLQKSRAKPPAPAITRVQNTRAKPPSPVVTRAVTKSALTKSTPPSSALQPVSQSAPCNHCRKNQRPLYHLTMSDNTIRNFCSYPCVIAFQAQFNVPPVTLPQETLMLKCAFCSTGFIHKPLTLEYKGTISLFCTQGCFDEFKRANCVVINCDYCRMEKILHDRSFFSGMAKSFCSEGCKLLFKQQFAQRLGLKCIVCDYCAQTCRSTVEMVYNKTRRRFCGIACRDKYDKWFNKTARCDGCKLMGRTLSETFMWRDEIKKVCDQKCLLLFYTQQNIPNMTTQGQVQIQGGTQQAVPKVIPKTKTAGQPGQHQSTTPVIANVMSLASLNNQPQTQQPTTVTKTIYRSPAPVARATKQTQITTAPPKIKPPPPPPAPLPPAPKMMRNKITLCKPFTQTKSVSCRPVIQHKSCQTDPTHPMLIPVPVPIFIPVPMHMYTTPVPYPVGINTPVPVPMFIPVAAANCDHLIKTMQEIRDKTPSDPLEAELLMMADAIAGDKDVKEDKPASLEPDEDDSSTTQDNLGKEEPDDASSMTMEEAEDIIPSDILAENILQMAAEMTNVLGEDQDLQDDIAVLQAPDRPPTPPKPKSRRTKRRAKGGRNKRYNVDSEEEEAQPVQSTTALAKSKDDAKKSVGINAFRHFIQAKLNAMSEKERKRNKMLRPDVLECATEELYFGLSMFVKEARQADGQKYSPDMLLLMFLSIQRELFDNERPENIFTDFEQFTELVHMEVKDWKPIMDPTTEIVTNSLVDEESLWNSKQLGAHSPYILLSTLLYFNTKCFRLNGVEQHKELAFVRVQKHLRKTDTGRTMYLRYFPKEMMKKLQGIEAGKRKRERDDSLDLPEQCENTENPLRCPVKLYEFFLSKCPESVKTRTDLFYLVPERSCIPDSPVWYTCLPLPDKDMNYILSRIMLTRDIHETWARAAHREDEEDYESD